MLRVILQETTVSFSLTVQLPSPQHQEDRPDYALEVVAIPQAPCFKAIAAIAVVLGQDV